MRHLLLGLAFAVGGAAADDVKVLTGSAMDEPMHVLIPQFERATGHRIVMDSDGAIGAMAKRIENGEPADVLIASLAQVRALEKQGKVAAGTPREIARLGVGLFVRKGAPKPDISTVEAFKAAMLAAKSIGYNDPAAGAPVSLYLVGLFERMGIAREMQQKTVAFKQRSERFAPVARGEVEIGFNQVSEIIVQPGVELVGPLPAPIQNYTVFTAGLVSAGKSPAAAKAFIDFVATPAAAEVFKAKGFE
ncbi:MAG TPA: molybdate ABC transporter substrate-binding protein [Burkholderiales bacterium]|nr:molybdate ABC transporter substrate-binding protein [Burkholderiales bacterium]